MTRQVTSGAVKAQASSQGDPDGVVKGQGNPSHEKPDGAEPARPARGHSAQAGPAQFFSGQVVSGQPGSRRLRAGQAGPAQLRAAEGRRRRIIDWMRNHGAPIPGGELAKHFRVSRQCLVQDVAILRAGGEDIVATPQGYRLPRQAEQNHHRAVIACSHPPERTQEELQTLVDNGVKILDVIVEHPLYGELRASLMLESRADVDDFIRQVKATKASLLSSLTRGVHLHTVEASRPEMITRAKAQLRARGFLLK